MFMALTARSSETAMLLCSAPLRLRCACRKHIAKRSKGEYERRRGAAKLAKKTTATPNRVPRESASSDRSRGRGRGRQGAAEALAMAEALAETEAEGVAEAAGVE